MAQEFRQVAILSRADRTASQEMEEAAMSSGKFPTEYYKGHSGESIFGQGRSPKEPGPVPAHLRPSAVFTMGPPLPGMRAATPGIKQLFENLFEKLTRSSCTKTFVHVGTLRTTLARAIQRGSKKVGTELKTKIRTRRP